MGFDGYTLWALTSIGSAARKPVRASTDKQYVNVFLRRKHEVINMVLFDE
jgi:hypothetical protein